MSMKNIRNFCIISHIDHGKSTLADRLLELTGTVEKRKMQNQVLDMMDLEREKGITIKLQPARMEYQLPRHSEGAKRPKNLALIRRDSSLLAQNDGQQDDKFILNLIDTPGHVDFTYEVSRSLAAVEGAVLLVDATQGIQAQTLANLHLAQKQGLVIIPVINKIDAPAARPDDIALEVAQLLDIEPDGIIRISAKNGINIEQVVEAIVEKIPAPEGDENQPLQALIFDSNYDSYQGVIAHVRIKNGQVKKDQKIFMKASQATSGIIGIGIFKPRPQEKENLTAGEIGYIATGLKDINICRVGDTITLNNNIKALSGYQESKPMVYASFFPIDGDDFDLLHDALGKLKMNDASLDFELESSDALGRGFRCGFLGLLHLEIIGERLRREYDLNLVITAPSVYYRYTDKSKTGMEEPWVKLEVVSSNEYLGAVMKLLTEAEGEYVNTEYLNPEKVLLTYKAPLREIMTDFYDKLKSATSGYASLAYQLDNYREADLVKLDIVVAGEKVEAFSRFVARNKSYREAKLLVEKLKDLIPSHQFSIPIQGMVGSKVIARETIKAFRKDVIAGLYGGDYTRKRKQLEKQKKGKKRLKQFGKVSIPQEVFLKALKK
ncbi:MAG: translation elongation factor 4 [bacterium]